MGQRKPDRADLLPAGGQAVDDSPRDHKMGASIVVAERQAGMRVVERSRRAGDERAGTDEEGTVLPLARNLRGGAAFDTREARGNQDAL